MSLAIFCSMIYFLSTWIYGFFAEEPTVYVADVGTLRLEDKVEALIIRNEMLVRTELRGKLTYFFNEGDRVQKGQAIAEVFNDGKALALESSNEREQEKRQTEFDYNVLGYDIEKTKQEILLALDAKDFVQIPKLKKDLEQKLERMDKLKTDNRFLTNRSEVFTEQTVGKGVLTEGQKRAIQAPAEGILSYASDGLENILAIDNLFNVNVANMLKQTSEKQILQSEYTKGDQAIFRLVDQATYYLAATIPVDSIETYQKGMTIRVDFGTLKTDGEVLDAYVEENNGIVVVRLKEAFEGFHVNRKVQASFVKDNFKGIKVPTDSIVNQDGVLSVLVVESSGKLKRVPVKIIGYDAEYAVVYNEQFYDAKTGIVRSIKIGQTLVRNAHMYKEGQLLE